MHAGYRLLDGLVSVLETALGVGPTSHLVRRRVCIHVVSLVLRHALLAKSLVVTHAEHVDGLVMLCAIRILLNGIHVRSHRILHHLRAAWA